MIHHIVNNEEVKELRRIFFDFDKDGDGRLSRDEIWNGFISTIKDKDMTVDKFKEIFNKIDDDQSGYIEFEEFLRACINKKALLSDEKLDMAFKLFDRDGGGSITPDEIRGILGLSAKFSKEDWKEIIEDLEATGRTEVT